MQDDLIALAERCETEGDSCRQLDEDIHAAVFGYPFSARYGVPFDPPAYTSSLDAAATLIPAGWWWSTGNCSVSADASCGPDVAHCSKDLLVRFDDGIHVELDQPSTPALALCVVALRARAAMGGGDD